VTRFEAAIFDLNGTLIDDIAFHFRAWRALGERLGFPIDESRFQSFNGMKNTEIFRRLLGRDAAEEELATLAREKEETYRALYRPHLAPIRGAEELMARMQARGMKLALASSAPPENKAMALQGLGWTTRFHAIVSPEGLPSKPAPDIFLAAAAKLGVAPATCVAFEDSDNGVRSAAGAAMTVVGITTNVSPEVLREAGASFCAEDFASLPGELEERLFPTDRRRPAAP
jgi:HAD superfamily hydrolase (TIGR01509 family)